MPAFEVGARIHTIGHSTRSFDDLVEMLRPHGITALVDVRSFPSSRRHPQWDQAAITAALPSDITYHWIRELGGRRHTPAGTPSVNGGWDVKAFRDYADYMAGGAFQAGLEELIELAHRERVVIMCSEAVPWRCHRRLITDALLVAGLEVIHIVSATATRAGTLTSFARVHGTQITYPRWRADRSATDDVTERVRQAVCDIPAGRVASYGDIGRNLGVNPRQVGRVMARLDDDVPWWRVVYADGTPATCHGNTATALLAREQTPMAGAKVDMRRAR